ncbi:MAG: hypothetical protein HYU84_05330 [Chloroflexi bacterium]|nr:hypothetical protein [Chloroflexota bacterium]MBI3169952.1 hypothetical protein [Chloroflexota bacterium]
MLALRLLSEGSEGPNTELLWLLLILLGLFVLVIVFGWLSSLGKLKQTEADAKREALTSPIKKEAVDDMVKPKGVSPRDTKGGRKKK